VTLVYRVASRKYANTFWSGEGAIVSSSRWLPAGFPVVYTAESVSLAVLEYMVHDRFFAEGTVVIAEAEIPGGVAIRSVRVEDLGRGWDSSKAARHQRECRPVGLQWVTQMKAVGLRVPSAVTAGEWNVLLNTGHRDFTRLRLGLPTQFKVDERLLERPSRRRGH